MIFGNSRFLRRSLPPEKAKLSKRLRTIDEVMGGVNAEVLTFNDDIARQPRDSKMLGYGTQHAQRNQQQTGDYQQLRHDLFLAPSPNLTHSPKIATREELPEVIRLVMETVKFGELDIQIEDVAEKGTAELRIKQKPAAVRKAS